MATALPFLKVFLLFSLTGLSLFRLAPRAIREIHSWVDRIILSLLTGIAFYTIFFLLAQGLMGLPLNTLTVWGTFFSVVVLGTALEIYRRRRHLPVQFEATEGSKENRTEPNPSKKRLLGEIVLALLLVMIFFFSLNIRLKNGLQYPDKLLDADPYRHHIRTEALVETGRLSKYDPYIVGEIPIFELQGCYILAGVLGVAGPFSPFKLWQWGSQVFGALSVVSLYLFAKLALWKVLQRDLGPPVGSRKKNRGVPAKDTLRPELAATFLGLMAASLLSASPVHILRTNAGFSEAYAIPLLAPTLLFYLWAAQSRIWGDFIWFGIFFSALAFINPVPAVFIVPFFMVHALYVFVRTRDRRWLWGNILAGSIFFTCLAVWNWKFLATPLLTGMHATGEAGTTGILKNLGEAPTVAAKWKAGWSAFSEEIFRNLGFINLQKPLSNLIFGLMGTLPAKAKRGYDLLVLLCAYAACLWILWDRRKRSWQFDETTTFFFLSYTLFFIILFLIPFGFLSFTSKYYRYLLPISLSLSVMIPYFMWRTLLNLFTQNSRRKYALMILTALTLVVGAEGRTWGGWVLNCSPEEYAAADWIRSNTGEQDFIIANWYTGDYIRSLTKRRILISDYPRVEVRLAKEKFDLKIPVLSRNPQAVLEYTRENPGNYFLLVSKWGPWGKYEKDPHFELRKVFGKDPKTQARIFRINPAEEED